MEKSHERTNANASFQRTGWIHIQHKKTRSLDYSRHLCGSARSAALIDKRPSKSFSDTDAIEILKQRRARRQSDTFNTTNVTLERQSVTRIPQVQVYQKDKTFHRKYGSKSEGTGLYASSNSIAIHRSCINSPTSSSQYFNLNDDDCARSFCDSVSSLACSNFTFENDDEKLERKLIILDRFGNFIAIETWLQCISTPVL